MQTDVGRVTALGVLPPGRRGWLGLWLFLWRGLLLSSDPLANRIYNIFGSVSVERVRQGQSLALEIAPCFVLKTREVEALFCVTLAVALVDGFMAQELPFNSVAGLIRCILGSLGELESLCVGLVSAVVCFLHEFRGYHVYYY